MNAVSISGNLGRDAVIKSTSNGTNVTRFSLACNRKGTDGKEYTDWVSVVVWGDLATEAGNLKKGDRVMVFGRMGSRSYTAQDGSKRSITELVASEVYISLRGKSESPRQANQAGFGGNNGGGRGNFGQFGPARSEDSQYEQEPLPF